MLKGHFTFHFLGNMGHDSIFDRIQIDEHREKETGSEKEGQKGSCDPEDSLFSCFYQFMILLKTTLPMDYP